jgi:putative PIN family toxin of toxin-antitoxin system
MLRLVLDTDVLVAALDSPTGASRALLTAVADGHARLLLSTTLLLEYEAVLMRPAIRAMTGLAADEVLQVLDDLTDLATRVYFDFRWRPTADDPGDDHVVETAINGQADAIATFNVADMRRGAARFGIDVERPGVLLRRLRT